MTFVVMCIGNRDGGDDAVGPYIFDQLKDTDITAIDCGISPESFTGVVKKYTSKTLLIVDAVDMALEPGKIRIVSKEKIGVMTVSTHGIPIPVMIDYLSQYFEKILFIGIQPKVMIGEMTDIVKKSADKIVEMLKNDTIDLIKNLE